jgi:hypothetical protein
MARWIEAQSPVGTLRLINVDVAARVDFLFMEGSALPFLAQVYPSTGSEFDQVIEPAAEQLYAYLSQTDALVPGAVQAPAARETPIAPTTLSERLLSESSGDTGVTRLSAVAQA